MIILVPTITNKPTIPANTSDLTHDSGFLTAITGQDIGNLQNVYITSVQNGHVLKYNSTSGNWENGVGGSSQETPTLNASVISTDDSVLLLLLFHRRGGGAK